MSFQFEFSPTPVVSFLLVNVFFFFLLNYFLGQKLHYLQSHDVMFNCL
jgi:hypothetical protein